MVGKGKEEVAEVGRSEEAKKRGGIIMPYRIF